MPNKRTYTDEQLRLAVASCTNWSAVMATLGKKPGNGTGKVKAVAERLGLDTSHFAYARSFQPVAGVELPFTSPAVPGGQSGLSIAARWFLDRGYIVSIPLEPAPYDLVTESDDGLKKVQVKTTRHTGPNGRYYVDLSRKVHDVSAPRNANGNRRRTSYETDQVDYFFVISPVSMYLIPLGTLDSRTQIVLDEKYAAFAI